MDHSQTTLTTGVDKFVEYQSYISGGESKTYKIFKSNL